MTATSDEDVLKTSDLTKEFGSIKAVSGVNLSVRAGEFHSIIGPNGAGKTTLFNLLSGAISPTDGTIHFKGADITDDPPEARVHRGLARSFQINTLFENLTVGENIRLAVQARKYEDYSMRDFFMTQTDAFAETNDITETLISDLSLTGQREQPVASLSYGDRRRLELGLTLATDPDVLLLDEPTAGMETSEGREILSLVQEFMDEKTIVLVEHNVEFVTEVSDRITVLERGGVIADGTPAEIQQDETVQDAYFGDSHEF
jgi:branched-chain amino acid transport system ATP-binding protein